MQLITSNTHLEQKKHGTFHFPLLVSYETLSRYDSGAFALHWHPEVELTRITKGEMKYKIYNKMIHLKENDALFCNSGALHSGSMINGHDCKYISITFDPKLIYGYENSALYRKYVWPLIQNVSFSHLHFNAGEERTKETIKLMDDLISLYERSPDGYEMDISIALTKIWKIIFSHSSNENRADPVDSVHLLRFRAILSYIELHYSERIKLSDISKQINLCESECCRLFKKITNISIFDYLQKYRIDMACEFLAETDCNVSKISEMVGFSDANHFSKTFRKYNGQSPREYRNRIKNAQKE